MEAYEKSTRPLIDFYQKRGLLVSIKAEGSPEEIYQRTRLLALAQWRISKSSATARRWACRESGSRQSRFST